MRHRHLTLNSCRSYENSSLYTLIKRNRWLGKGVTTRELFHKTRWARWLNHPQETSLTEKKMFSAGSMSWTAPWKDQYQHQHRERGGLPLEVSCSGGQWSAGMTLPLVETQHKGGGAESPHQLYGRNSDTALSHTVPLHQFRSHSSDPPVTEGEGPTPQHAPLLAFPMRLTTAVRGCWGGKCEVVQRITES